MQMSLSLGSAVLAESGLSFRSTLESLAGISEHRPQAAILRTCDHRRVGTTLAIGPMPTDTLRRWLRMVAHQTHQVVHADLAVASRADL